jgi:hypothetical protein
VSEPTVGDLDRLLSLLAARGTHGVTSDEAAEIQRLLPRFEELDESALDLAIAGVELAVGGTQREALPPTLRVTLETEAEQIIPAAAEAAKKAAEAARLTAAAQEADEGDAPTTSGREERDRAAPPRRRLDRRIGWALGAVSFLAGFLIAIRVLWG